MRSRLQGAFYARAFLGMWYTFAAYLRQFTVRRSHLRKRCGEKERGAMSGSTFVSALSFDSGSPLFSFDSGSPLFSVDSGSPLFSFDCSVRSHCRSSHFRASVLRLWFPAARGVRRNELFRSEQICRNGR